MAGGFDKKGKMLETPVQTAILNGLTRNGILCWRSQPTPVPHRRKDAATGRWRLVGLRAVPGNLPGFPDISAIHAGRYIGIEAKREAGGIQTPDQERWERDIRKAGGVYIMAKSWAEAAGALMDFGLVIDPTL